MKHTTLEWAWARIQLGITALGGWLGYFLGGADGLLTALREKPENADPDGDGVIDVYDLAKLKWLLFHTAA